MHGFLHNRKGKDINLETGLKLGLVKEGLDGLQNRFDRAPRQSVIKANAKKIRQLLLKLY